MVSVSRLGGKVFFINPDLIEVIEETPDTVISMTNGTKYVVAESADVLIQRIIAYRREVFTRLPQCFSDKE